MTRDGRGAGGGTGGGGGALQPWKCGRIERSRVAVTTGSSAVMTEPDLLAALLSMRTQALFQVVSHTQKPHRGGAGVTVPIS